MKFRSLSYYIREASVSLLRNRLMALASIVTVMSCIFIVSISYCIAANIDYFLKQVESSINLSAYIKEDVPAEQVPVLHEKITSIEGIKEVIYIPADKALENFKESLGDDNKHLLDGLELDNPMPRTFSITLKDVKSESYVAKELDKLKPLGIEEIKRDQEIINFITNLNTGIRIFSIIIILGLIIVSVVIIINTIKITVNSRRMEIVIMKYIGATDWFIRWPFIIEGILIGIIGAIIPITLCWISYGKAISTINSQVKMLESMVAFHSSGAIFGVLIPLGLFIGIFVGVIGSVTSLSKYLKA